MVGLRSRNPTCLSGRHRVSRNCWGQETTAESGSHERARSENQECSLIPSPLVLLPKKRLGSDRRAPMASVYLLCAHQDILRPAWRGNSWRLHEKEIPNK